MKTVAVPVVPVDLDVDLAGRAVVLLVGGDERGFDDLAQRLERDVLLPAYVTQCLYEIYLHFFGFLMSKSGMIPTLRQDGKA